MNGFEGPFRFEVDSEGTEVSWDKISEIVRAELEEDGKYNADNSKIYTFKIAVLERSDKLEKHHDWAKVSRVCIQTKLSASQMRLAGVSPRNKRTADAKQHDLGFDATATAEGSLFDLLRFKVNFSSFVKQHANEQKFAVLNSFTKKISQWVYSRGWPFLDFTEYLYVAVPNDLELDKRIVSVTVKAVRSGNIELTQVGVFEAPVKLAA